MAWRWWASLAVHRRFEMYLICLARQLRAEQLADRGRTDQNAPENQGFKGIGNARLRRRIGPIGSTIGDTNRTGFQRRRAVH